MDRRAVVSSVMYGIDIVLISAATVAFFYLAIESPMPDGWFARGFIFIGVPVLMILRVWSAVTVKKLNKMLRPHQRLGVPHG